MNRRLLLRCAGLGVLALAGCTMAPDYERPAAPVDAAWPSGPAYQDKVPSRKDAPPAADIGWHDFFSDPRLRKLVGMALENNRDLRVAALNVAAARAQYQIQGAALFPTIDATASAALEREPAKVFLPGAGGGGVTSHVYSVGLGFTSYELDLYGRLRSLKEQTLQKYLALEETEAATQITLVSEVANAYLTWLADRELLRITRETLQSQTQSYDLEKQSASGGIATDLDVRQAETAVRTAEANLAAYTRQMAQDMNALVLLVGQPLGPDVQAYIGRVRGLDEGAFLTELPEGLPSSLLERRPDIRSAEHGLMAANAYIGAARAAFFPAVILTASGGTTSTGLSGLFASGSQFWSFSPVISLPLFDGGVNLATLRYAKVEKQVAVAQYEKAIQTAFREVADGLAARGTLADQVRAQDQLVTATAATYHLYQMRYGAGVDTYLNVLLFQRSLYAAQQDQVAVRLARLQNLVTLYKALGGGWTEQTVGGEVPPPAPAPAPLPR